MKTRHLAESHLLSSLGGNGLRQKLTNFTRVEMVDKSPHTRFTKASKTLAEVGEFADSLIGVIVSALGRSSLAEHVGQKRGMSRLLISHKLNVRAVLRSQTRIKEVLFVEYGETIVEQIELDPLLVQAKGDRLEVEVTLNLVTRKSPVGTKTTWRC